MNSATEFRTRSGIALYMAGSSLAVIVASWSGFLGRVAPYAIVSIIAATIVLPAAAYFALSPVRRLFEHAGIRAITAFHVWRIAAAFVFFWYGWKHLLPAGFVTLVGWGDLLSGVMALLVISLWRRRAAYWTMHLFGMADFLVAVGTGLLLTLEKDPLMHTVTLLPVALIPFFGVGLSGATHLIAFHMLSRGRV